MVLYEPLFEDVETKTDGFAKSISPPIGIQERRCVFFFVTAAYFYVRLISQTCPPWRIRAPCPAVAGELVLSTLRFLRVINKKGRGHRTGLRSRRASDPVARFQLCPVTWVSAWRAKRTPGDILPPCCSSPRPSVDAGRNEHRGGRLPSGGGQQRLSEKKWTVRLRCLPRAMLRPVLRRGIDLPKLVLMGRTTQP